jgi:hypothetical protein
VAGSVAGANGCSRAIAVAITVAVSAAGRSTAATTAAASTLGQSRRDHEHTDCQREYESAKHQHRCSASFRAQAQAAPLWIQHQRCHPSWMPQTATTTEISAGWQTAAMSAPKHFRRRV